MKIDIAVSDDTAVNINPIIASVLYSSTNNITEQVKSTTDKTSNIVKTMKNFLSIFTYSPK